MGKKQTKKLFFLSGVLAKQNEAFCWGKSLSSLKCNIQAYPEAFSPKSKQQFVFE